MSDNSRKNELLYRVYAVLVGFSLLVLLIGYRIVKVSVFEGDKWKAKKENTHMLWAVQKTQRGNIYAEDGQSVLATSVEFFEVRMDTKMATPKVFDEHINGLSSGLAKFDNRRSAQEWKNRIVKARKKGDRYLLIAKKVDHIGLKALKELPIFNLGRYEGGIRTVKSYVRERPYQGLAARTIGIARDENAVGLENGFNRLLRGEEKKAYMKKMPGGILVPVYDPTEFEIIKGKDLVTTIDIDLQDIVHNELLRGIEAHNGEAGTAILMDVKTGAIKAVSNLSRSRKTGQLGEFQNYGLANRSEPGSSMKAASVLMLLEDDAADSQTLVDFNLGRKNFHGLVMKDSGPHNISQGTLKQALEKSSNVGIASIIDETYNGKEKRWSHYIDRLKQFGLLDKSGVEIEGEPKPFIKHPKKDRKEWYNTTIPWMSHGYEMEMTPMQVLRFYNAIANDGTLVDARLVKAITSEGKIEKEFGPKIRKEKIASPESVRELQVMLEGVVERGTAKNLKSKNYNFAGKTGTTKVGYGTDNPRYNASFTGYWPAEAPEYSMIVVIYGLTGDIYYGNKVAGPVFKRIMDWCYAIDDDELVADVKPDDFKGDYDGKVYGYGKDYAMIFDDIRVRYDQAGRWIKGHSGEEGEVLNGKAKITSNVVPNLKGMGLRDAVYVLENLGMKVETEGYGKVVKQSVKAGRKINGDEIKIYLN